MTITTAKRQEEDNVEATIRPLSLADFTGQEQTRENLRVFIEASKNRGAALDHTLLYGPPGLGKTTISHIIANELGVGLRTSSGPIITKAADLAAILTLSLIHI
jgi:Holliday junction DNA helicase RuvB